MKRALFLIVFIGTALRLFLAYYTYGNYDMDSWRIVAEIVSKGGNVYSETTRYPYSLVWSVILCGLQKIQIQFPVLPFHFLVKSFLSLADLLTLFFLLGIAGRRKIPLVPTALFFYLNPVSFLLTGYHGQFENLALLAVFAGVYFYSLFGGGSLIGKTLLWTGACLGTMVKHIIFYELIICLNASVRRLWVRFVFLILSAIAYFILFIPFWGAAADAIVRNVFLYPSIVRSYGFGMFFPDWGAMKYVFIAAMCVFPFFISKKDFLSQCLLGTLFFLVFTTGIAIHYFVLPVAFGALRPSKGFLIYSVVGSLFILGSPVNLHVEWLSVVRGNYLWVAAVLWFVSECARRDPATPRKTISAAT